METATPFRIHCPSCMTGLKATESLIGTVVPCPKCKAAVQVQRPAPPPMGHPSNEDALPTRMTVVSVCNINAAAAMSFVIVGMGQVYKGDIGRGLLLMFAWALMLAFPMFSPVRTPDAARALSLVSIAFACGIWVFNVFDAATFPRIELGKSSPK